MNGCAHADEERACTAAAAEGVRKLEERLEEAGTEAETAASQAAAALEVAQAEARSAASAAGAELERVQVPSPRSSPVFTRRIEEKLGQGNICCGERRACFAVACRSRHSDVCHGRWQVIGGNALAPFP